MFNVGHCATYTVSTVHLEDYESISKAGSIQIVYL